MSIAADIFFICVAAAIGVPFIQQHCKRTRDREVGKLKEETLLKVLSKESSAEKYLEELKYQATHDHVTGLPNRLAFSNHLAAQLLGRDKVAVMLFDLDNFKVYNDTLGHTFGDAILLHAARRLSHLCCEEDFIARLGGDEFVIVPSESRHDKLLDSTDQILEEFINPFCISGREICLSASVGVAFAPDHGKNADELLRRADIAMYRSKQTLRGGISFFSEEMETATLKKAETEARLRQALVRNEFVLHYQPQVDMKTGRPTGAEALLRWQRTPGVLCSPNDFIPLLEESDLINDVGEWVIKQACRQMLVWRWAGLPMLRISVNVSSRQLQRPDFADRVISIVEESGIDPQSLCIELTESMFAGGHRVSRLLKKLGEHRIAVSIDDFGTGYSSLQYLHLLPITEVKIDRSFVAGLTTDGKGNGNVIVAAIVGMAKAFGMETVAEGIETEEQYETIKGADISKGQGFLMAKPMPEKVFEEWLYDKFEAEL